MIKDFHRCIFMKNVCLHVNITWVVYTMWCTMIPYRPICIFWFQLPKENTSKTYEITDLLEPFLFVCLFTNNHNYLYLLVIKSSQDTSLLKCFCDITYNKEEFVFYVDVELPPRDESFHLNHLFTCLLFSLWT